EVHIGPLESAAFSPPQGARRRRRSSAPGRPIGLQLEQPGATVAACLRQEGPGRAGERALARLGAWSLGRKCGKPSFPPSAQSDDAAVETGDLLLEPFDDVAIAFCFRAGCWEADLSRSVLTALVNPERSRLPRNSLRWKGAM